MTQNLVSLVQTHLVSAVPVQTSMPTGPKHPDVESEEQVRWQQNHVPYRDAHASRLVSPLDHLRQTLEESLPGFQTAERDQAKRVQQHVKELGSLETAYNTKETALEQARDRLRDEFKHLSTLANVQRVRIDEKELVVETTDLILSVHDRAVTRWNLGPWAIHIPRSGRIQQIRCESLRRPVRKDRRGWIHPHVSADGNICWGNLENTLSAAAETAQYDVLAELILTILADGRKYTGRKDNTGDSYAERLMDVGIEVR